MFRRGFNATIKNYRYLIGMGTARIPRKRLSGDVFRLWLETVVRDMIESGELPGPMSRGNQTEDLIAQLSALSDVSERQLHRYLDREEPSRVRFSGGENPQFDQAVRMSKKLRKCSGFAHPLYMLNSIDEFMPHAWGVIGKLCLPGPTKAVRNFWPAIQWVIFPKLALKDRAFEILTSTDFNEAFDTAWEAWIDTESTDGFPDELVLAIEHAICCREVRYWKLAYDKVRGWAGQVAANPQHYGVGMRFLDLKVQGIRDDCVREMELFEEGYPVNVRHFLNFSQYSILLCGEEREAITRRAIQVLNSRDEWKDYVGWLD